MAVVMHLKRWWIWLAVSVLRPAASESERDQKNITAESGQNVTLPCRAPNNNNILVVEWSRADLETEYVLLYRDGHPDPAYQHPSFMNRVELQDRQMKDGNVSLILKDVTASDARIYECRIIQRGTKRRKRANLSGDPISIINLVVAPPGQTGGHTEDGGEEGGGNKGDRVNRNHYLVALLFCTVVIGMMVIFVLYFKKYKQKNSHLSSSSDENQRKSCFQKKSVTVFLC